MRAIVQKTPGDTSVLQLAESPTPEPGPNQIRVRVRAAGLNRADILQRRGLYPAPPGWPAEIPGLEYAGEVESLDAEVTGWRLTDRVMGLVGGGAHAEYVVVHEDEVVAVPEGMSWAEAAAIPEAFYTAWDALVTRGRLQPGERALIHAVGSGVGTAAIQLVKLLKATSVGTSRSLAKLSRAKALGLDEAIDTSSGGFREGLSAPVHVILDVLGGPAFFENLEALAPRGRLVMLGHLQGAKVEGSIDAILRKRLEVIGSVMRTRSLEERVALTHDFSAYLLPAFAARKLEPVVGATFPFTRIAEAHQLMEEDENFGKIVLVW